MPAGAVNIAPMGVEWGDGRHRPEAVPRDRHLPQRDGRARGRGEPGGRRARVRARGDFQPVVPDDAAVGGERRAAGRRLLVARAAGAQHRQHAAAVADRDGRGAPRRPREFIGFNRAAMPCSRRPSTPRGCTCWRATFVEQELARLQVIVDKTAGPAEHEAMALITDYVRSVAGAAAHERARRGSGVRRGARAPALRRAGPARHHGPLVRRHRRRGAGTDAARVGVARRHADRRRRGVRARRRSSRAACWRTCGRCAASAARRARARAPGAAAALRAWAPARSWRWPSARALAELHDVDADAPTLARTMGRAKRSAIGTWTFAGGGLVVEGGRRVGQDESAPLLARLPFPPSWRCVVAVPHARAGVSGAGRDAGVRASCRRRPRATSSGWRTWC